MHWSAGWTGAPTACGERGVPEKFVTQRDASVKCGDCKNHLREYRRHFPQAHPEKREGGAR